MTHKKATKNLKESRFWYIFAIRKNLNNKETCHY